MSSTASAPIRVRVNPANPGQFFACCGLLELADRHWHGAEGWFDENIFCVSATGGSLMDILNLLVKDIPEEMTIFANGLSVKPLIAPLRLLLNQDALILDSWVAIRIEKGKAVTAANSPWNFWSGQQTPLRIWTALRNALENQLRELPTQQHEYLFSQCVPLSGRFGFDPGAAWNALDTGFSPNEQKIDVDSSPATELLAAVGLQRFRPRVSDDCMSFNYSTWGQPLAPSVACAAASGVFAVSPSVNFRGRVVSRGNYSALGYSTIMKGESK